MAGRSKQELRHGDFSPIATVFYVVVLLLASSAVHAEETAWDAPPLDQAALIVDGRTREPLSFEGFVSSIADADAIFLGEQHTDETTHRVQLAVYERLLALKENKVVLALEMFDRDVQPLLDRYLAGEIDETEFLAKARPWANYREAYRPLIELAKKAGAPVVASNFPTPLRQRLAMEGAEALAKLSAEEKELTPRRYFPNSPAYWKRVDNAVRGHVGMTTGDSDDERLYSTQSLWDNSMGESCALALDRYPDHVVLHINGGFHSAYWDGTVEQFRKRKPDARLKTVAISPVGNPPTYRFAEVPSADYAALVESRATNLDQGKRAVRLGKDLSYLFHWPESAVADRKFPLLIWLADDGLTAEEGMELCKQRFGDAAAIAVVEAPYKELQFDLAVGGRWFWPDRFTEDAGALLGGIEEIWAYLLRHFPIDPDRVCLAGEGTGATTAAFVGLHTDRMSSHVIAIEPRQFAKLKDVPLPLPEYRLAEANPKRSLAVAGPPSLEEFWNGEIAAYSNVGVPSRFVAAPAEPWQAELRQRNLIAEALGCDSPSEPVDGAPTYLVVSDDSTRAKHWGRLQAAWLAVELETPVAVVPTIPDVDADRVIATNVTAAAAALPGVLPRCPGPFGGTTVLVLPDETTEEEAAQWVALEADDPLTKASRFHRVRIATGHGDRSLPALLEKLHSENRRNVLIVPATFYASADWLHSLRHSVKKREDLMTLQWAPGLGGRKNALNASPAILD